MAHLKPRNFFYKTERTEPANPENAYTHNMPFKIIKPFTMHGVSRKMPQPTTARIWRATLEI